MKLYTQQTFTQEVKYSANQDYWDVVETEKQCQQRRDEYAKQMKARGFKVRKSSNGLQLMSFGGIGTGRAHFTLWLKSYAATVYSE